MPRESGAISLLDAISETGFQSSIIATYCCYFPFYEEVILRRLLDRGCTNNVLMVDSSLCAEALASEDTRPRRAGRDYTLIPVDLNGAFHPKLIITLGKSKGALFIGSHNATLAGFGLNDELTNEFRTGGPGARQGAGIVRAALDYLYAFLPRELPDVARVLGAMRRTVPWLEGPLAVGSTDRLLLTTTGRDADLWSQIKPLVPKRPSTAFVCGPFFDSGLHFLRRLDDDVKPRRLIVGIDPESVAIDATAARRFKNAEFVNIAGVPHIPNRRDSRSHLHAKILWFAGTDGELLVTGSANPSQAALLASSDRRNAEAVIADRRVGAAEVIGVRDLVDAPAVDADGWRKVAARHSERSEAQQETRGTVVLSYPTEEGLRLARPVGSGLRMEAFAHDGSALGEVVTGAQDDLELVTPELVRDEAQVLRGIAPRKAPVFVFVHRPDDVARYVGGDRQRELRQALGALEEDPGQLDALLKLTEKVIFDSDDIVSHVAHEPALRVKAQEHRDEAHSSGPESLAVDAAGRRASRKKRRLASGDILVLLDALMSRLGEGLTPSADVRPAGEEVRPVGDDDSGEDQPPPLPPRHEELATLCRKKVGRLVDRMSKQLEAAHDEGPAHRAIVQLAAVLSVIHTLRIMELRTEWRTKRLTLVDPDHQWKLLESGALALSWNASSLAPRSLAETNEEAYQELSLATGLLAWLAWETDIDVRAALDRTSLIDPEEEQDPWYAVQVFATVAVRLAKDADAQVTVANAIARTARKDSDGATWLTEHLDLAQRLAALMAQPVAAEASRAVARPGLLVVLGPTLDPRVRVVLEVVPTGSAQKVTVFDYDEGQRQFLTSHVVCVDWRVRPDARRRAVLA